MVDTGLAVVTGASSGIGLELAHLLAADGYDLVIAADDAALDDAAADLARHGTEVRPVRVDLREPGSVWDVYDAAGAGGRAVDVAALNAGTGRAGRFVDDRLDADLRIVDVNVRSTVALAKLLLRDMARRDAGRVLVTSSLVAMMPGSYQSMYNASKAFLQSFTEALHDEFRGTGVTVTALLPGATDTEFFRRVGMLDTPLARLPVKDDPAHVAKQGYDALLRGDAKVVASSPISKATGAVARVLPDSVKAVANRLLVTPFGPR